MTGAATELATGTLREVVNEVRLRGRWAGAVERELPSGDLVVTSRVVVSRGDGAGVDTIDCAVWPAGLRRRALRLPDSQVVDVVGQLRRRFWRAPGGPASRYEVEVRSLRRVPATPAAAAVASKAGVP